MNRKVRFFTMVVAELSRKYTVALILGFLVGVAAAMLFWRVYPVLAQRLLTPVERRGIVGEFTPSSLPLSIQAQISFGLTRLSPDGSLEPGLATSWEATDSGKTFIFHLRDGLIWHTGKPVEARDINYNIRDVILSAPDRLTLRASLSNPYSPFPSLVAKPIFLAGLKGLGEYQVQAIKLKSDKVQYLRLVPVAAKKPVLEYYFYRTEALAQLGFKLGEVDIIEDLTNVDSLSLWGKVKVEEQIKYNRIVAIFFNLTKAPLGEKAFRQVLAYGLPAISGERALSPISKTSWAYTDSVRKYQSDQTTAKRMLTDSQVSPESVKLTITTFAPYLELAQAVAANWTSLGIATGVKVENEVPADFDVLLSAQDLPPDPDQYPFWHSTQKQTNITGFNNVKIDKLLEDGRQELDPAKRARIYIDFQKRLVEEAPVIFLYYPKTYTVKRGNNRSGVRP